MELMYLDIWCRFHSHLDQIVARHSHKIVKYKLAVRIVAYKLDILCIHFHHIRKPDYCIWVRHILLADIRMDILDTICIHCHQIVAQHYCSWAQDILIMGIHMGILDILQRILYGHIFGRRYCSSGVQSNRLLHIVCKV